MSKKLKKNFGSVSKGLREASDKERSRRPSVGTATQSTKRSSVTIELLREKEQTILAVRLVAKRPAYQVCVVFWKNVSPVDLM